MDTKEKAATGEFRHNWRAMSAASIGLAAGYTFINYVTNTLSPFLIADLGWDKSSFALLGLIVIVAVVCQPIGGRLADLVGVRPVAAVGVVAGPLLFVALSRMSGPFWEFYLINLLQVVLVGGTTGAVVYTRLIATRFVVRRGLALGISACMPAVAGALLAPVLSGLVEAYGWRTGYLCVAGFVALAGAAAILLVPVAAPQTRNRVRTAAPRERVDYRELTRSPPFLILMGGMLLCNLSLTLQMTQVKIVLLDIGISAHESALMISIYGSGVIAGRLLCGAALDRFEPATVAALTMASPAAGLLLLAAGIPSPWLASVAVGVLGLASGAEGDVGAYLVMRYFPERFYGTVFGLVMSALALSGAIGALLLSALLALSGGRFGPFLVVTGFAALAGGGLFLLLRWHPTVAANA